VDWAFGNVVRDHLPPKEYQSNYNLDEALSYSDISQIAQALGITPPYVKTWPR